MILSGRTIAMLGIFSPFTERMQYKGLSYGLGPAGYDVCIAEDIVMPPQSFALASTVEHFTMPLDVLGMVADKSTWARMGLAVQNTIIEPGWRGHLTLELTNHGRETLTIERRMPIAQIILQRVDMPTVGYGGKYQDQPPQPVGARFTGWDGS